MKVFLDFSGKQQMADDNDAAKKPGGSEALIREASQVKVPGCS
jgi:hypothetical protein